ncbi:MAG TPA: esterase-like activity of phytase family protein [Burkholderiaceae bacterium]|nr:esterase-like activity of phytase family protein [Burkholderiaceae bacterium]
MLRRRLLAALALSPVVAACSRPRPSIAVDERAAIALEFLGEAKLPALDIKGMRLGGLSGIDYDAKRDIWWLVTDDRSEHAPARVYTARISWTSAGLDVQVHDAIALRTPQGALYPKNALDPETVRVSPTGTLWIASEGVPRARRQPWIREFDTQGNFLRELPLPQALALRNGRISGPYDNASFEGLAFTPDGQSLWACLEGPLKQDDDEPSVEHGAMVRFTRFDLRSGQPTAQYAYPLSAMPKAPLLGLPARAFADTGISEVLSLDAAKFLVIERSYAFGAGVTIHLYLADADNGATDVITVPSLRHHNGYTPLRKRLVLNSDTLPVAVDNLEGIAIGPRLPSGARLLVMCADDNFSLLQSNQFLAFALHNV